jgi:transposase, IS5 family
MSTPDVFCGRLDAMIDLRHPLAVLVARIPWASVEATLPRCSSGMHATAGSVKRSICSVWRLRWRELAGAGSRAAGRPRLPVRLIL